MKIITVKMAAGIALAQTVIKWLLSNSILDLSCKPLYKLLPKNVTNF